jgi:hypothetical protein
MPIRFLDPFIDTDRQAYALPAEVVLSCRIRSLSGGEPGKLVFRLNPASDIWFADAFPGSGLPLNPRKTLTRTGSVSGTPTPTVTRTILIRDSGHHFPTFTIEGAVGSPGASEPDDLRSTRAIIIL